jgi:hypothetical protein
MLELAVEALQCYGGVRYLLQLDVYSECLQKHIAECKAAVMASATVKT